MIIGFNTDIKYRDEVFHIQTEDKGEGNPTIETLVYHSGEILLSRRVSYAHIKMERKDMRKKIKAMMKIQHDQVIGELKEGKFLHLLSSQLGYRTLFHQLLLQILRDFLVSYLLGH